MTVLKFEINAGKLTPDDIDTNAVSACLLGYGDGLRKVFLTHHSHT